MSSFQSLRPVLKLAKVSKKPPASQTGEAWEEDQSEYPEKIRKALEKHGHLKGKKNAKST